MKVIMMLGKVRHTSIVRNREQAWNEIKINLFPLQKKGDSLVWTKSSNEVELVDTITIVKSNGDITQNSAQILTGGTEVAKAKKVTKEKKTEPEVKITKKTTPEVKEVKKPTPVKKEVKVTKKSTPAKTTENRQIVTAHVLSALPKKGMTAKEITAKITEKGLSDRPSETKRYIVFAVAIGYLEAKGDRYIKC